MFQTCLECSRRGQVLQSHPLPISPLLQRPEFLGQRKGGEKKNKWILRTEFSPAQYGWASQSRSWNFQQYWGTSDLRNTPNFGLPQMGCNRWGLKGVPSWKSAEIGLFRLFSAFRSFPGGAKSSWEIQKTEEKGSDILRFCLNPHLLNPHLRHSKKLENAPFSRTGSQIEHFLVCFALPGSTFD